jgi:hypothetical protein
MKAELAKPEHPLDKKADNARELGLDYEPDAVQPKEQKMKNSEVFLMGVELSIDNDQFTLKAWTEDKGGIFKSLNHRLNHALKVLGGGDEEDVLRWMLHQRLDAWLDYHKTGDVPELPDLPPYDTDWVKDLRSKK